MKVCEGASDRQHQADTFDRGAGAAFAYRVTQGRAAGRLTRSQVIGAQAHDLHEFEQIGTVEPDDALQRVGLTIVDAIKHDWGVRSQIGGLKRVLRFIDPVDSVTRNQHHSWLDCLGGHGGGSLHRECAESPAN